MKGQGGIYKRGVIFWCHYSLAGRTFRESTGQTDDQKARRFLRHRLDQLGAARRGKEAFIAPKAQKISVSELLDSLERDLKLRGKLSPNVKTNVKHLRERFGLMLAMHVTADDVNRYIEHLLGEGYRPASVNRHTQLLGQSYRLAIAEKRLNDKPFIRHLSETGNARTGFASEEQVQRIASHLPDHLRDLTLFAFYSAWRRNEVLTLTWDDVDGDTIRLRAENSKEREARSLALEGECAAVIERRRKARNGPLVFHCEGHPIVDFRKAWKTATRMAGVPGLLYHDLRRSAVRGLIVAGTAPHIAMSISGHKTDSMLRRYAIISEADQRAALIRTEEFRKAERAKQLAYEQAREEQGKQLEIAQRASIEQVPVISTAVQ